MRLLSAIFVLFLSLTSAVYSQTFYQCQVNKEPGDWIPQNLLFRYKPDAQTTIVADDVTLALAGGSVVADAKYRRGGDRVVLSWKIDGVEDRRKTRTAAMVYKATFDKKSLSISMSATPLGFSQSFTGRGKCSALSAADVKSMTAYLKNPTLNKELAERQAQKFIYNCKITRKKNFTGVTPDVLRIEIAAKQLTVSDDVMKRLGLKEVVAKVDRRVEDDLLFGWSLSRIPNKMKPAAARSFYRSKVHYTARLNLRSGRFSMLGNFVTTNSSANDGREMRGTGKCTLEES